MWQHGIGTECELFAVLSGCTQHNPNVLLSGTTYLIPRCRNEIAYHNNTDFNNKLPQRILVKTHGCSEGPYGPYHQDPWPRHIREPCTKRLSYFTPGGRQIFFSATLPTRPSTLCPQAVRACKCHIPSTHYRNPEYVNFYIHICCSLSGHGL